MEAVQGDKQHTLTLCRRECAEITGVCEVESFDEQSVLLRTDCGELCLEGEGLHVGTLDIARGVVEVMGRVDAVSYTEQDVRPRRRRLFH